MGHDGTLITPMCQGAIIAGKSSVWFSNPASKVRANYLYYFLLEICGHSGDSRGG